MDPCRPVVAAFVISLTFSFAACFGSPTNNPLTTAAHGSSSSGHGGSGATASKGSSVAGTGGAGTGGEDSDGGGTDGMAPSDGSWLDVAEDAIGKGGLPEGAMCGADGVGDGGSKCGAGLACCYPCKHMMCDTLCVLECNPSIKGCINGCVPMP